MMRGWVLSLVCSALLPAIADALPLETHPRLWLDSADATRMRSWANDANPIWQQGLHRLATDAAADMDEGTIPADDNGGSTYSPVNTEAYAALFAFMALIDPDSAARAEWAQRGRTLLFHIVDRVDTCMRSTPPIATGPYCTVAFPVSDRSRWQGAAFPLAVDWLGGAVLASGQPALSAADKAKIRRTFIWWSYLNLEAYPNPYNNPPQDSLPVGTVGEPLLRLDDPRHYRLRFSGNNYFAGHMRQLGMMALALDRRDDVLDPLAPATYLKTNANGDLEEYPFDDANGRLTGFLHHALDGWLFMQDYLLRHDARGGLPVEGMEYAATSIGIPAQFLLAVETSGHADSDAIALHGEQVAGLATSPFYRAIVPGYLHSLSPMPFDNPNRGWVYWPAWYGDGEAYYQSDSMGILGPLGVHAARVGDAQTLDAVRWIERHVPPGGSDALNSRARGREDILESILYFMLFDPGAASSGPGAADPRPALPLHFWSAGLDRLLSRSSWLASASWFDFKLGWDTIDHQHGDGLMIELMRNGEWLTKGALGYGLEGGATDYKNSLTIENTLSPGEDPESSLARRLVRGAQMPQNRASADPPAPPRSEHATFSYATGDATTLYNAWYDDDDQTPVDERADEVQHVSRSVVWLKPDRVIVYDRARTQSANRSKRFWLNLPDRLPAFPSIAGNLVTSTTPGGQKLFVTSVLPAAKMLSIVTDDAEINLDRGNLWSLGSEDPILQRRQYVDPDTGLPVPDTYENYATRLRIEATGPPSDARFLTLLEGADAGAAPTAALSLHSAAFAGCGAPDHAFEGAGVATRAILFRADLSTSFDCLEYVAPTSATMQTITGLVPHGYYGFASTPDAGGRRIRIASGGALRADEGGVLDFDVTVAAMPSPLLVVAGRSFENGELSIGAVAIGDESESTLQLANVGSAPLAIDSIVLAGDAADYSLSGSCPVTGTLLSPDASCDLVVRFSPTSQGFAQASLAIDSDSVQPQASIAVVATAISSLAPDRIFASGFEAAP